MPSIHANLNVRKATRKKSPDALSAAAQSQGVVTIFLLLSSYSRLSGPYLLQWTFKIHRVLLRSPKGGALSPSPLRVHVLPPLMAVY